MAINLTVALTDAEQAIVSEVAARVAPGATAAQIKTWAEKECKNALRARVLEFKRAYDADDDRAAVAARNAQVNTDFPIVED
jgi:hypothetical protein